jgi:CRP-like cAMP-binding protein
MNARDLRSIPLFSRFSNGQLEELATVFERRSLIDGELLFDAGAPATHFQILVRGEILLEEGDTTRFRLSAPAPIGELGALTGVAHNVRAIAGAPSEVWRVEVATLLEFFERRGEIAVPFYRSLLEIVSDKVRRDEHRLDEMRANIVRTQKAMKRVRDLVLESPETPISAPVVAALDELVEQNRRGHYLVEPARALSSTIRLDDGRTLAITAISEDHLSVTGEFAARGAPVSAVLVLPNRELPISGTVAKIERGATLVKLDLLVDEYAAALRDYLVRVQMLDFVV